MKLNNNLLINDDESKLSIYKKDRESVWLDTNNKYVKIVVFGKEDSKILVVAQNDKINESNYTKYTLRKLLDNEIELDGVIYRPVGILSKEGYEDGKYKTFEHLAMETIDEFRGLGLGNEMFRIKESIDNILTKSSEKIVSNIYMLLKNGYKVVGKINKNTGEEEPFNGQKFIEKIIDIKIKKGDFNARLDTSYVFEKE